MKKVSEMSRPNVNNCQEDTGSREYKQYSLSNSMNLSKETGRAFLILTCENTPGNESDIRGMA